MLEQMMRAVAGRSSRRNTHTQKSPSVVYATVSKATQLSETFGLNNLVIYNEAKGEVFPGRITAFWNEYTLVVVDRWEIGTRASRPFPGVRSKARSTRSGPLWPLLWHTGTAPRSWGRCSYDRVKRHRRPTNDEWASPRRRTATRPLCSGLECLYQNIILEALTQPGDLL